MGMVKNFQQRDVAEALELLLHMVETLATGGTVSVEDVQRVRDLAREIKQSR
jgi:hypothetical protein